MMTLREAYQTVLPSRKLNLRSQILNVTVQIGGAVLSAGWG